MLEGDDITLISTGGLLQTAVQVAELLRPMGLQARVLSMHTIKPLDVEAVLSAAQETRAIFTLEEHSITGGLGGAVAEVLAEADHGLPIFRRFGLPSTFASTAGTQEYLRSQYGLSPQSLAEAIRLALEKDRSLASAAGS